MLLRPEFDALAQAGRDDPDLAALLARLRSRVTPVLAGRVAVPRLKALLSRDGGVCAEDGAPLRFDPLQPSGHACPRCGRVWTGERHDGHWARAMHLWIAERIADLSVLAALDGDPGAAEGAADLLDAYGDVYLALPNRDNVLGPSHLFFSTYLESMWVVSALAGAFILREAELLPDRSVEAVNQVAEEAAGLIGSFNEGLSNRQTWHAAALSAIAAWFGDEELAQTAIGARTGLLGHLADGFGEDGLWWEGENYHLFALRGLMLGLHWARALGVDLLEDPELRRHFRAALRAPAHTALPDFTYPARGDSRYGASLAQPAFLELWEIGRAWLGGDPALDSWLATLYALPPRPPEHYDAWLHDAILEPSGRRTRGDLSWWALGVIRPAPSEAPPWEPTSQLLSEQGLAILRHRDRYASLECGRGFGGHGHPDRLHLTLHAGGVHWLPDPGTGSYVHPSLAWYRSALAHNAPILDGQNAGGAPARCEAFDVRDDWGWARGRAGEIKRTVIAGPSVVLDLIEVEAKTDRRLELPWHLGNEVETVTAGRWEPAALECPWLEAVERFEPEGSVPLTLVARAVGDGPRLVVRMVAPGAEVLRARVLGLPSEAADRSLVLIRDTGVALRWVTALDLAPDDPRAVVSDLRVAAELVELETPAGAIQVRFLPGGVEVAHPGGSTTLGGLLPAPLEPTIPQPERYGWDAAARAPRAWSPPALDGSLDGFDTSEPLVLVGEQHYRPSEEPFEPEEFAAQAWVHWDDEALYLAVEVTKSEVVIRAPDAPALRLDNEPDDIHADGLQLYLALPDGAVIGMVVSLEESGRLRCRGVEGTAGTTGMVDGVWLRTDTGYRVTLRLAVPGLRELQAGSHLGFDLIINEMRPGRLRRAGQLVWSGGDGWVYLRGDRQDPSHFGWLELA